MGDVMILDWSCQSGRIEKSSTLCPSILYPKSSFGRISIGGLRRSMNFAMSRSCRFRSSSLNAMLVPTVFFVSEAAYPSADPVGDRLGMDGGINLGGVPNLLFATPNV